MGAIRRSVWLATGAFAAATLAAAALASVASLAMSGKSAPAIESVRTQDADTDGRIDGVRIVLGARDRIVADVSVRVRGYTVRRVRRNGRVLLAELTESARPDTGARPLVTITAGSLRAVTVRARDGAPPIVVSAAVASHAHGVVIAWSEPMAPPATGSASDWALPAASGGGWRPRSQRVISASVWDIELAPAGTRPVTIVYRGGSVRDRAGNMARPFTRSLTGALGASTETTPAAQSSPGLASRAAAGAEGVPVPWRVLQNPIDPWQQTALGFCDRSYWLQPWRAYLDTRPTSALDEALGINFNVAPEDAATIAKVLTTDGFRHARIEEGWSQMSYADPTQIANPGGFVATLLALQANGIRPLILLNADQGVPGPRKRVNLSLVAPAPAGAQTVQLEPRSAAEVVPGLTGFDDLGGQPMAAEDIITGVNAVGTATLSKPLPSALAAGGHAGSTLRFEPFAKPYLADGSPNPRFEATLTGWLQYVAAVVHTARAVLGSDNFDVEIWNELNFHSAFLAASNYYSPLPTRLDGMGDVPAAILSRTLSWLRDPVNGVSGIGVTDGFASQTPFDTGAGLSGLTALSKHPYAGALQSFGPGPWAAPCRPLNAEGHVDGALLVGDWWLNAFTPSFVDYFPEYYLTAIQTEHLIRDVSPITTAISGVPHGRFAEPATWVTETNIDSSYVSLAGADRWHMLAKATLRTLVSFVNKGVSQLDFYAVWGSDFGLVDPNALVASTLSSGGAVTDAIKRTLGYMGTSDITTSRSLSLLSVADQANAVQFQGDGTTAHPPLYNREVLAVFPFQASNHRFVVPAYVMTRNIAQLYQPSAPSTDLTRYDLPPEAFRLTIGGVNGASASVAAYDPLYDQAVQAQIAARTATTITVQLPLTDSPRLIRVED